MKNINFLESEQTNLKYLSLVASKEQISSKLGQDAVILNLKTGVYHGLDAVGARVWNLLQQPTTMNDIRDVILNEYEVEPEQCEQDLVELLQRLADVELIEVENDTAA